MKRLFINLNDNCLYGFSNYNYINLLNNDEIELENKEEKYDITLINK
jgi:hypothetical protein